MQAALPGRYKILARLEKPGKPDGKHHADQQNAGPRTDKGNRRAKKQVSNPALDIGRSARHRTDGEGPSVTTAMAKARAKTIHRKIRVMYATEADLIGRPEQTQCHICIEARRCNAATR